MDGPDLLVRQPELARGERWPARRQGSASLTEMIGLTNKTLRLGFITAMPQSVRRSSGCYVGIKTLAAVATALGCSVEMILPTFQSGSFLAGCLLFNKALSMRRAWNYDVTVGFDVDGFALPAGRTPPHVANIKGVLADALPFESGWSKASMAIQARWEAAHTRGADLVITTSQYCRTRIQELYGMRGPIAIVPEMIDLELWQRLFRANPAPRQAEEFAVLCVCRF